MFHTKTARLGLAAALALGAVAVNQQLAGADVAPSATDVVGVGSDVIQNSLDFIADGDIKANPGYNSSGNKNRLISIDATADANGRNGFIDPALSSKTTPLSPSVVLRAGTSPVKRPNGGSAGLTALTLDGSNGVSANRISFARSPNLPTAAQLTTATNNLGSTLRTVRIASDKQVVATASTTNAPAALTTAQLVSIYKGDVTTWDQLGGTSTDKIIPLIPQVGAGVRNVFLKALKAANGNTDVNLAKSVVDVQQNDPNSITGLPAADQKNAIVPFPVGRYNLIKSGYFVDPTTDYDASKPATTLTTDGLSLQDPGTTGFSAALPYYVIFRQSDFTSKVPWQPGGTLNWVQELFANPGSDTDPDLHPLPYVATAAGQALLKSAGVTPDYKDLGVTSSG